MESPDQEPENPGQPEKLDEEPQGPPSLVEYSTGRLTAAQANAVIQWRARLQEDRPLPGQEPKGPMLRLIGLDDRPPASCSDVIAAAVQELLDLRPPDDLAVARYAHRAATAQKAAGQGGPVSEHATVHQPVTFYLPEGLAARYDALRASTFRTVDELIWELRGEARKMEDGALWLVKRLAELGLPHKAFRITGGVIARMAIDHVRRRKPDRVVAAAVDYAAEAHEQPHRARRDMHTKLKRG
ncbi:hypothetical protein ACWDRB_47355 [Nonomuraea sp. NPDC003707]